MIIRLIPALAALLVLPACAGVTRTILDLRNKAEAVTEEVVRNSVEGARAYCGTMPETTRARFRALTDVAGKGPVIEVHCENL